MAAQLCRAGVRKAAICPHTLYLAGMVLISHSSLALAAAWMPAAVLPGGHPLPKTREVFLQGWEDKGRDRKARVKESGVST